MDHAKIQIDKTQNSMEFFSAATNTIYSDVQTKNEQGYYECIWSK